MTEKYLYDHIKKEIRQQPTMEEPEGFFNWDNLPVILRLEKYSEIERQAFYRYKSHIESLKSYPATGFDESFEGRDLVEGKDFEIKNTYHEPPETIHCNRGADVKTAIPIKGEDKPDNPGKDDHPLKGIISNIIMNNNNPTATAKILSLVEEHYSQPSLQGAEQPAEGVKIRFDIVKKANNDWDKAKAIMDNIGEETSLRDKTWFISGYSYGHKAGSQGDAVEFAEWIGKSGYGDVEPLNTLPSRWLRLGVPKDAITTPELFKLFLQSKQQ